MCVLATSLTSFRGSLVTQDVHNFPSACITIISQRPCHSYAYLVVQSVILVRHLFSETEAPPTNQSIQSITSSSLLSLFSWQVVISTSMRYVVQEDSYDDLETVF